MKVLITFVLLLAAWAGCPLEVMAQQANTTVSRTTVAKDKEPDSVEISAYDNKIVVENAPAGSKLEVYSVVGIRVKRDTDEATLRRIYGGPCQGLLHRPHRRHGP